MSPFHHLPNDCRISIHFSAGIAQFLFPVLASSELVIWTALQNHVRPWHRPGSWLRQPHKRLRAKSASARVSQRFARSPRLRMQGMTRCPATESTCCGSRPWCLLVFSFRGFRAPGSEHGRTFSSLWRFGLQIPWEKGARSWFSCGQSSNLVGSNGSTARLN